MKMKKHLIQYDSIVNFIQNKLMKVIDNMRNMMMQEFQYFGEFQLIQLMIQFDSIVNFIRMKLMKVIYNDKNMMIQEFQHSMEF
jgi:hypothetical protein